MIGERLAHGWALGRIQNADAAVEHSITSVWIVDDVDRAGRVTRAHPRQARGLLYRRAGQHETIKVKTGRDKRTLGIERRACARVRPQMVGVVVSG